MVGRDHFAMVQHIEPLSTRSHSCLEERFGLTFDSIKETYLMVMVVMNAIIGDHFENIWYGSLQEI